MNVPIITAEQAKAQGSTPSELRALANSLERIGRKGYDGPSAHTTDNIRNAHALRRLAKTL